MKTANVPANWIRIPATPAGYEYEHRTAPQGTNSAQGNHFSNLKSIPERMT